MNDIRTKASQVFDLHDFISEEAFSEDIISPVILNADLVYDKILKPFADTVDALKEKRNKYHVEIIEPYNYITTNDAPIGEIALALFDITNFKLIFYYRLKFRKLTEVLINHNYEKYSYDSVYTDIKNFLCGYRRISKYMISPEDRARYYLSCIGETESSKEYKYDWLNEFNPVIRRDSLNHIAIDIGCDDIEFILPAKYEKFIMVKYPFKHSLFLNYLRNKMIEILKTY